ncbi:sigma-70 family RNA polymerase sigma factor [Streptomyces lasalocidi]|uniref:Sigma-70 family RNA polymerase sigma factor n=1 Tax=Streptomyces lasalocidi TaxID=324833 RepID=A0A4U5WK87_STRLS|nr:sigma-70 family RNA polymerase sigma factor [Streptomyces lasalocidi]TKT01551.1 sigma-70 family RNA polymerase sigma factor [Streptomyces lasalocidi]
MSVDGRDESLGDGDAEAGRRPPQVPGQGGRPTAAHDGVPAQGGTRGRGAPDHGAPDRRGASVPARAAGSTGPAEGSVPAQREWRGRHGDDVLPSPHGGPPHDVPPSDAELIDRMRSGDDSAYEELYRRHADAVRRYARTCCRDGHTADDLTAEVFARMLQAVRGGSGPEHAVRAYLLTSVRRVAAHWTRTAKREHLVDDFAVFAAQASRSAAVADDDTLELGADVRAMHEAEQSMAMRAFRSLPERWQAVLWHTEVEDESPSEVAVLFGLDANGTRVLASRAREGLKQAYLQAHVSTTLTSDEECARYADQLGTYARRRLRVRAERGLRKHLEECARCRLAAAQIEEVAGSIPAVVPVAVIGWFGAAGYAKALGLIAGGAGAGAAGAAGAAAAGGGSSGAGAGGAASEGLGAPVKAGIAAGVVAVAAAVVALALVGHDASPPQQPEAGPRASAPAVAPAPTAPAATPPGKQGEPVTVPAPGRTPSPGSAFTPELGTSPRPTPAPARTPSPTPTPAPTPPRTPTPTPPSPTASPTPAPPPPPVPVPAVYRLDELAFDVAGDGTRPEIRLAGSSWVWQRSGLSIADRHYRRGVTVHGDSSVTVDLNRTCTSYDAVVGVDDLTLKLGHVYFSVYADGVRLWRSGRIKGGDPAVPVHVDLTGHRTVRLVVEPHSPFDTVALADWADSAFSCS